MAFVDFVGFPERFLNRHRRPSESAPNERHRDLLDLNLLRDLVSNLGDTKQACLDIFESLDTHGWPPTLDPEPSWAPEYRAVAVRHAFALQDVDQAVAEVRESLPEIDDAA